jgi:hypothetical protein
VLRGLFRKEKTDDDMPCSIVMLLRSPFAMSKEVLEIAAESNPVTAYQCVGEKYSSTYSQ